MEQHLKSLPQNDMPKEQEISNSDSSENTDLTNVSSFFDDTTEEGVKIEFTADSVTETFNLGSVPTNLETLSVSATETASLAGEKSPDDTDGNLTTDVTVKREPDSLSDSFEEELDEGRESLSKPEASEQSRVQTNGFDIPLISLEITDKINEVDEVQIKTEPLSDSCVPLNPENKSDRSSNAESSSYSLTEKAFWGMSVRIKTESFSDTQELSTSHQVKNTRTKFVPSLEEEITGLGLKSASKAMALDVELKSQPSMSRKSKSRKRSFSKLSACDDNDKLGAVDMSTKTITTRPTQTIVGDDDLSGLPIHFLFPSSSSKQTVGQCAVNQVSEPPKSYTVSPDSLILANSGCRRCGTTISLSNNSHIACKKNYRCKLCEELVGNEQTKLVSMAKHTSKAKQNKKVEQNNTAEQNNKAEQNCMTEQNKIIELDVSEVQSNQNEENLQFITGVVAHIRKQLIEKEHKCDQCGRAFSSASSLSRHKRSHAGVKSHKCDNCGKTFTQSSTLSKHMRSHTGERPYVCEHCGKAFSYSDNLTKHKFTHTGERPYQCDQCDKTFSFSDSLTKHMRTHTGEKLYKCEKCGKAFTFYSNFSQHLRRHSGEKHFKCEQCDKTFCQHSSLIEHKRTHTGERPYICKQCNKTFARPSTLRCHLFIHAEEKPYKCNQCSKSFLHQSILSNHMYKHTGEKPYKCEECGKAFIQYYYLSNHKRTHTGEKPYQCDKCGKAFCFYYSLAKHLRTHTGEKPYQCDQCGRSFSQSSALQQHKLTHTGKKIYKCEHCSKSFAQCAALSQHRHTHTGTKLCKSKNK